MKNEKEIRKLLGNDYHLSVEYNLEKEEPVQWVLFKNYADSEVYFSDDNKPIMRSGLNTEEELYDFAKNHHRLDYNKVGDKVIRFALILIFVISIINIFVGGIFTQIIFVSDFWLLIWLTTNHKIFEHNWKIDMLELAEIINRRTNKLKEKIKEQNNELR